MFVATLGMKANDTYAQRKKLDLDATNVTLSELIDQIESESEFKFTFKSGILDLGQKVSISGENLRIKKILNKILKNTGTTFTVNGRNILLQPDEAIPPPPPQKPGIQTYTITGSILDDNGMPIPGASIQQKDSSNGTISDFDGKFSLTVNAETVTLVFSYIGFTTIEQEVRAGTPVTITLDENISELDAVVVVGYGTQKKKDLTGSIAHLELEGAENSANTNIVQALQGMAPGLNASSGSTAGSSGGLSIRGKTSLSASDYPLIVLDGMIYNGSIADFNINDIASIDVLKDASAAAVYGSRSANGVIVITSKKGKSDKPTFNFNVYGGIQDLMDTPRTQVMNGDQYAVRLVDYYYQQDLYDWYDTNPTSADGRPVRPDVTDKDVVASYLRTEEERQNYLNGNEINWMDEIFRTAPVQSYNFSISGNSDKTNYYLSSSLTDQDGIIVNDKFKRMTVFGKFQYQLTDWMKLEFAPQFTNRDYSGVEASLSSAMEASPLGNKYNEDGGYPPFIAEESAAYHPLGNTLIQDDNIAQDLRLVFKGYFDIPFVEGLKYEVDYSKNFYNGHTYRYYPKNEAEGSKKDGYGYKTNSKEEKWLWNNIITYNRTFGDHRFDVTLLHSEEELTGEGTTATGTGFSSEKLGYNALEVAEVQTSSSSGYREFTRSFMGRLSYILKDRYMLTGTIRRDGFSGFGPNKKWGNFPSVSLGWVASEESFLNDSKALNYLKLRASYGVNGNQGIGRYNSQSNMTTTSTVFDGSTAIGYYSGSLGNSDLGWEKTISTNGGIDFEILDGRLGGSIDAYWAKTTDVLVQRAIPRISGNSSVWTNIGGMKNHGIEVSLNGATIKSKDFQWNTGVTFALNRNEITKLYDDVTEDIGNGWFVGESFYAIYNYETDGIYQEDDLFNGNIVEGYYPGQFKIVDQNGDGQITAADDRKIIGSTDPNYRFSINNEFTYKNISLNIFLNSIQGGNNRYISSNNGAIIAGGTDYAYRLNRTSIRDYWRPDNPVNNAPAMFYSPKIGPGIYEDKSFVRLQDITLTYKFDDTIIEALGVNTMRVYASGKNLYTWTKWSGWDPDVGSPVIRSVVLGVNVNF
tara:strand:- start:6768 stop:10034 length:3267 start_codon:yes stop_codon:yes gene_type:complete